MKLTQPMLYLGLGGTGCLVGTELERRLRDELCGPDGAALSSLDQSLRPFQLPPYVQFVYSDLNEAELAKVRRRVVPTEEHLTAAAMTQHLTTKLVPPRCNSYPEVALNLRTGASDVTRRWLPPQVGEPRVAPLIKGAGQLPTVGRAAMFETMRTGFDALRLPLLDAIAGLAKSGGHLNAAGSDAKRVTSCDAFIGFSLAGGTGAGIYYDYIHLLGREFEGNNIKVQIHPLVLMPSAFAENEGGGRRAALNAAPALVDLFQLIDDQNSPGASNVLGERRTAEALGAVPNVTAYSGRESNRDRITVAYPHGVDDITLQPATVQTAFLFSRTVAIEREDLHRSIVSFILSMIGTELEAADDGQAHEQTYQSFAADFVNQGVERQAVSYSGIGRRPVSTSLVASMTVPVDDLADIVSSRLLARAVDELAAPAAGGAERNRALIEAFFDAANLGRLRTREGEHFAEQAPAHGKAAVAQALYTRITTMASRLPVLAGQLRTLAPKLARDFDYLRAIETSLGSIDPFRLSRVVLGDPTLAESGDRAGFTGSLEARRQPPPAPQGMTNAPPSVEPPRGSVFRQPDWTDPEVRAAISAQNTWYKWRTDAVWNAAWGDQAPVWDPKVARLRSEIGGLVGAFLAHSRSEADSFALRTTELYRSRTGVTYLLPPLGDLEVFYRSVVRRFLARAELGLRPTSTEADIVNALLNVQGAGWLKSYQQINKDSNAENRYDGAVQHVRNVLKQEIKGLFVTRGVFGDEQPLLPALRDLLAKSAGKEGPVVGEDDLLSFQRGLAELLPAAYVPEGSGQLKILVAYPQGAKDPLIERYVEDRVNFPVEPNQTVEFRAVDTESLTIVLLRTSMGVTEVPELRRVITHWSRALQNELPQDFLAWRQRLGYNFRWLASTENDRVEIMQHLLSAMWNNQVRYDGDARSPSRVIISLPGDEQVSVVLGVEPYGPASSWADLLRAYEQWVFSSDTRDEQIRPVFCQRLIGTLPNDMQRRAKPSKFFDWFTGQLLPQQVKTLTAMRAMAPPEARAWINQLLNFWTKTVKEAYEMPFYSSRARPGGSLRAMHQESQTGFQASDDDAWGGLLGPEDGPDGDSAGPAR